MNYASYAFNIHRSISTKRNRSPILFPSSLNRAFPIKSNITKISTAISCYFFLFFFFFVSSISLPNTEIFAKTCLQFWNYLFRVELFQYFDIIYNCAIVQYKFATMCLQSNYFRIYSIEGERCIGWFTIVRWCFRGEIWGKRTKKKCCTNVGSLYYYFCYSPLFRGKKAYACVTFFSSFCIADLLFELPACN